MPFAVFFAIPNLTLLFMASSFHVNQFHRRNYEAMKRKSSIPPRVVCAQFDSCHRKLLKGGEVIKKALQSFSQRTAFGSSFYSSSQEIQLQKRVHETAITKASQDITGISTSQEYISTSVGRDIVSDGKVVNLLNKNCCMRMSKSSSTIVKVS